MSVVKNSTTANSVKGMYWQNDVLLPVKSGQNLTVTDFYQGKRVALIGEKRQADVKHNQLQLLGENYTVVGRLTVFDNSALPLKYQQIAPQEIAQRVEQWLTKLAISPLQKRYPKKLSGGERQRVAIARALITKPPLILADEPTGALDDENERQVMSLLQAHRQPEQTLVLVTHNDALAQAADQVIEINLAN